MDDHVHGLVLISSPWRNATACSLVTISVVMTSSVEYQVLRHRTIIQKE